MRRGKAARPESGPAPRGSRERTEPSTEPPPAKARSPRGSTKPPPAAAARDTKPPRRSGPTRLSGTKQNRRGAATVDEVTADLSKDPRRERD
jgi:hypothetical protein